MTLPSEVFTDVVVPPAAGLESLAELATSLVAVQERIARGEALLKELKEQARQLGEDAIPSKMDELGMRTFTLTTGHEVRVESVISASLSGPQKPKAIAWLRATGHDSLIKRDLTVSFPKGADQDAHACLQLLRTHAYTVSDKEDVNTTSFKALVKELIAEGQPVPIQELGVYVGRKTTITHHQES
jgi:hypothetical protein